MEFNLTQFWGDVLIRLLSERRKPLIEYDSVVNTVHGHLHDNAQ